MMRTDTIKMDDAFQLFAGPGVKRKRGLAKYQQREIKSVFFPLIIDFYTFDVEWLNWKVK